jgi:hypothetical protein
MQQQQGREVTEHREPTVEAGKSIGGREAKQKKSGMQHSTHMNNNKMCIIVYYVTEHKTTHEHEHEKQ